MSVSQHTSQKRKFVYQEVGSGEAHYDEDEYDSEDSSPSIEQDDELEKDLHLFDDDQAAIIRNINRLGSMRGGSIGMDFQKNNSLSPVSTRRKVNHSQSVSLG